MEEDISTLHVGDLVHPRSHPTVAMEVVEVRDGKVHCQLFDAYRKRYVVDFEPRELAPADPRRTRSAGSVA
jgi:hypothetical protein